MHHLLLPVVHLVAQFRICNLGASKGTESTNEKRNFLLQNFYFMLVFVGINGQSEKESMFLFVFRKMQNEKKKNEWS